jgi:[lysine-biosynthesis-protein LysW]--L-2-aminoadipate ligase
VQIAIIISRIRAEEKLLLNAFDKHGLKPDVINDNELVLSPTASDPSWSQYDLVLQRSLSTTRGLYTLAILESWGVPTLNTFDVSKTCADKVLTTIALTKADIPQPPVRIAYTQEAALKAMEDLGYPVTLKPTLGSWGRLLSKINDRDAAEAILEHRHTLGNFPYHVHYIQAYVDKQGRDIRAFVLGDRTMCAIYRNSTHWITNTARGGITTNCPISQELELICRKAAHAVGGGMLAIDLFETDAGLVVNEINHTMEFRNSIEPTGVDIPAEMVDFVKHYVEMQRLRQEPTR